VTITTGDTINWTLRGPHPASHLSVADSDCMSDFGLDTYGFLSVLSCSFLVPGTYAYSISGFGAGSATVTVLPPPLRVIPKHGDGEGQRAAADRAHTCCTRTLPHTRRRGSFARRRERPGTGPPRAFQLATVRTLQLGLTGVAQFSVRGHGRVRVLMAAADAGPGYVDGFSRPISL
jgi:hypothetical protein